MQGLNKYLPKELHLPTNPYDIVEKFSCDSDNKACMNSKCNICKLPEKIPESGGFETDDINIEEWKLVDRRAHKKFRCQLMSKKYRLASTRTYKY